MQHFQPSLELAEDFSPNKHGAEGCMRAPREWAGPGVAALERQMQDTQPKNANT